MYGCMNVWMYECMDVCMYIVSVYVDKLARITTNEFVYSLFHVISEYAGPLSALIGYGSFVLRCSYI